MACREHPFKFWAFPSCISSGFSGLISSGFLIISSLRDELLAVILEVSELIKLNKKNAKALEGNANIQQDITDVKLMI